MRKLLVFALALFACNEAPQLEPGPVLEPVIEAAPVLPEPVVETTPVEEPPACPSDEAVDPELLERVIEALKAKKNVHKFVLWDEKYGTGGDFRQKYEVTQEPGNVQVVYVRKGVRYTLWHNPDYSFPSSFDGQMIPMSGHIAVWERPDGTWSDTVMETYSDNRIDGCVNFGIGDQQAHYLRWNFRPHEDLGPEHHAYWQERYNRSILALADVLDFR
jgi:hypothetical protein